MKWMSSAEHSNSPNLSEKCQLIQFYLWSSNQNLFLWRCLWPFGHLDTLHWSDWCAIIWIVMCLIIYRCFFLLYCLFVTWVLNADPVMVLTLPELILWCQRRSYTHTPTKLIDWLIRLEMSSQTHHEVNMGGSTRTIKIAWWVGSLDVMVQIWTHFVHSSGWKV